MFAPTKIWRRWHRKINVNQKRFAVSSALAASAVPSLVLARGHKIDNVAEIPLVVSNESAADLQKTKQAVALLKSLNAYADVEKVKDSRGIRAGKGKLRNRRRVQRRGPLVIYAKKGPLVNAFRNIPGIELASVERLNLLQLAPGGHLGRFCIWFKDAFEKLDAIYGTHKQPSTLKHDFVLPRAVMTNPDLSRIFNSDEVKSHLRAVIRQPRIPRKKNPLTNLGFLIKLNPHEKTRRRNQLLQEEARKNKKTEIVAAKREQKKNAKKIAKRTSAFKKALLHQPRIYEGKPQPKKTEESTAAQESEEAGEE